MKLIKTVNQKITINTYQVEENVTYKEYLLNGKLVKEQSRLECIKKKLPAWCIDITPYCLNKEKFNEYRTTKTFWELFDPKSKFNVIEDFDIIKKQSIYLLDFGSHLVYDLNYKLVSIAYLFDYIGSITERKSNDPIYSKIMQKLHKHKYVVQLTEGEIPYYNSEFSGQKGIQTCVVFIPDKIIINKHNVFCAQFPDLFNHICHRPITILMVVIVTAVVTKLALERTIPAGAYNIGIKIF